MTTTAGGEQVITGPPCPPAAACPWVSTLNWSVGQTRANNAVVGLGPSADLTVHPDPASGTVQLIIDVTGYFQ